MSPFSMPSFQMDSFRQFTDLPQIHFDENGPLNDVYACSNFGGGLEPCWNSMDSGKLANRVINISGTEVPLQPRNTQIMSNMQRFLLDTDKSACAPGLLSNYYGSDGVDSNFSCLDFNRPYEAQDPYPFYYSHQRYVSPGGSWGADRSATEQDSSSAGSVWSPQASQGEVELGHLRRHENLDSCYSLDRGLQRPSLDQIHIGYSSGFPSAYSHERSASDPCVALRDVQQYPDAEPEVQQDEYEYMDTNREYYVDQHQDVPCKLSPSDTRPRCRFNESAGSSTHGEESTTSSVKDEEDGTSEYQSTPPTKRRRRRSSQVNSISPTSPTTKRTPTRISNAANKITKRTKPIPATPNTPTICPSHPTRTFKSASEYRKHIQTSHTRPFICTFAVYGCTSTFGSKNEWKRHVTSQHLRLGFWRCDLGACVHDPEQPNDFNRKDLFTQHVRRMHAPGPKATGADRERFEAGLERVRQRCWVKRRETPEKSECGFCKGEEAGGRTVPFEGPGSWEERMEHVGRHFEKGDGQKVGWREDVGLREWMVTEGLLERVGEEKFRLVGLKDEKRVVDGEREEHAEAEVE
ncbi:MAG: hypothetical protein M1830_008424 [Pleopsidium flavum]|nr:MAG: hypothetical protein M1830_008424 [Pleopsidium flavum]